MLMMMTTIPSPHLMRTDTKREKDKEDPNAYRILCSIAHRRRRLTFAQKEEKNVRWKEGYKQKNYQTGLNFTYLDCILSIVCAELGGLLPVAVLFAFASISCITRAFERVRAAAEPPPPSSLIFFFDDNSPPFWAFSLSFFQN